MKRHSVFLVGLMLTCLAGICGGQADASLCALTDRILITNGTARMVEVVAHAGITNRSTTPITRFFFRVTAPGTGLAYQRSATMLPPRTVWKTHKNQIDHYVEFELAVPASTTVTREVKSLVLLLPVDYAQLGASAAALVPAAGESVEPWLRPSRLVESDALAITRIAQDIFAHKTSSLDKARVAYEYPVKVIHYKAQPALGALKAVQTGSGDCTEFACLFAALCRAGSLPARTTDVFNLGKQTEAVFNEPNHNAAEAFLYNWGWVPVDPNLGWGQYNRPVGFAKTGKAVILLMREGAWVWSDWLPADGFPKRLPKPAWSTGVSWELRVFEEGEPREMLTRFESRRTKP